jgi:hypothetical protein
MRESRVFRALICVEPKTKLFDTPQPLKLWRVDQTNHQFALFVVSAQANDVMDWISIDSFGHSFWGFLNTRKRIERQQRAIRNSENP